MKIYLLLIIIFFNSLFAIPLRQELSTKDNSYIYYIDFPNNFEKFPIILAIEGSYNDRIGPQSVLRLHKNLAPEILKNNIGLMLLEKRGIDGNDVNINIFHQFNTTSQRLLDHIHFIKEFKKNPPNNWNGDLIILGGSEGGPIAIKLAHKITPNTCIAIVGCGDLSVKEYIWKEIQKIYASSSIWEKPIIKWIYQLPSTRTKYDILCDKIKNNPDTQKKWFGQTFLYWSDCFDQSEDQEFLSLKCPSLIISGEQDIECFSTKRLIKKAKENKQNVTHICIKKMGHNALNPKWGVLKNVLKWCNQILKPTKKYSITKNLE